jgi:serine/threonine-protein kinase HipA
MSRSANVLVNNTLAGTLSESAEGAFKFEYKKSYLKTDSLPVSLTLPKREEPYISDTLFPFFDGLIPEGWLLDIAIENWKINPRDRMQLLLHLCKDCIGNISIVEINND